MSSQPEPEQTPELSAPIEAHPEPVYLATDPYDVTLTNCLNLLQEKADAEGVGHELSVRKVLLQMANMTPGRADRALDHLRGMSLYTSQKVGFQKSSYLVDTAVKTVTPEMVQQYRSGGYATPVAEAPTVEAPAEEPVAEVLVETEVNETQISGSKVVTTEATVAELIEGFQGDDAEDAPVIVAPAEPESTGAKIARLLDVLDRQDHELDNLRRTSQRIDAELAATAEERDRLAAENAALKAELQQLRAKPVVASPLQARIDSALARHR